MRFWDASALVPLLVEESASKACRQLLRSDGDQLVWTFTRVEIISALWRQARTGLLTAAAVTSAEARLDLAAARWHEVEPQLAVRDTAERLLRAHPLRAADALQLAAGIEAFSGRPRKRPLVTLDDVLAEAARREGFDVIVPA